MASRSRTLHPRRTSKTLELLIAAERDQVGKKSHVSSADGYTGNVARTVVGGASPTRSLNPAVASTEILTTGFEGAGFSPHCLRGLSPHRPYLSVITHSTLPSSSSLVEGE